MNEKELERRKKISHSMIGNTRNKRGKGWKHTPETVKKMRLAKLGKPHLAGDKNPNWKGGVSSSNVCIRSSKEYRLWRKSVYERDNYTCIWCGSRGVTLNADHIKPFCDYPELRFAIDNGRTLCIPCHKKTGTWGRPRKLLKY